MFTNYYRHEDCGAEWQDDWDCTCNDRCPVCNVEIEPYKSFDYKANDYIFHGYEEPRGRRESAVALVAKGRVHFTFDKIDSWQKIENDSFKEIERVLLEIHPKAHNLSSMKQLRQCGVCVDYQIEFNVTD
ncbi:hypothetical protein SAMN02745165_02802 [Malonomonas rubra DSM 5091]|uniref:Uncharacterized protein n=1 Tax=Malonomonas rubra DSM 5091 TaxID=1122189 RepID=A0A1M6KUC7_MALRU|nr:hypothetical protein [Malonomonas rubra]SHJ62598.1 hypothetical protein SAMN02745165_02802 [Malonomonas rubra DSM 5091]